MSTSGDGPSGMLRAAGRAATRHAKRVAIAVIGGTVLAIGVAMLVLPGPGLVVLVIGLGILGVEFAWARELQERARRHGASLVRRAPRLRRGRAASAPADLEPALAETPET